MAACRLRCDSLCVYFLIFTFTQVAFATEDYYLYNTDYSNTRSTNVRLELKNDHRIQKREATTDPPIHLLSTVSKANTSEPTKSVLNVTKSPPTIKVTLQKNLGENGTGIRKNYSSTEKPLLSTASTPIKLENNGTKTEQPSGESDEISIARFPDNKTLAEHNITKQQNDSHVYYNSTFKTDEASGKFYWVNMTNMSGVVVHELLSKSYRRAATVKLSFEFPFYGHLIRNVTIATGGFIYTGDYMHSWLAATQYIAPLMANFDTSLQNHSLVKYVDNGTAFTVQWENVSLRDKPKDGNFTFQATLFKSGDIVFVYKSVPILIENIQDNNHPVKVGLSDAYIIDRTIFYVRRKTIYEYHRINFRQQDIKNWTVIHLQALPTCHEFTNCTSCTNNQIPDFLCTWCARLNKCSNGQDRHKQEWITEGCEKYQIANESKCSEDPSPLDHDDINSYDHEPSHAASESPPHLPERPRAASVQPGPQQPSRVGFSSIAATLFIVGLIVAVGIWVLYAYRNPHTSSGQLFIRYRPSQWRWRRGEARYTAATIHM